MFRGYVSFGEGTCFCIYVLPSTIPKKLHSSPLKIVMGLKRKKLSLKRMKEFPARNR